MQVICGSHYVRCWSAWLRCPAGFPGTVSVWKSSATSSALSVATDSDWTSSTLGSSASAGTFRECEIWPIKQRFGKRHNMKRSNIMFARKRLHLLIMYNCESARFRKCDIWVWKTLDFQNDRQFHLGQKNDCISTLFSILDVMPRSPTW